MKRPEPLLSRGIESVGKRMRAVDGDHASAINFLHQKPAARTQGSGHPMQRRPRVVKMHQQPPAMYEVIRVSFQFIQRDVTSPDLDVPPTEILQEARVYIRCDDRTILAEAI